MEVVGGRSPHSIRLMAENHFLSCLAEELGADRGRFMPDARLIDDLRFDDLQLLRALLFVEELTQVPLQRGVNWAHATLADLYARYTLDIVDNAINIVPQISGPGEGSSS